MNSTQALLKKIVVILIIISVPVWLSVFAVRVLLTDAFLKFEYNRVDFPEDRYGMSREERLEYAPLAIDYLVNNEPVSFLQDLRFPDGSPQYNERELRHMDDVQFVINIVIGVHNGITVVIAFLSIVWLRHLTTRRTLLNAFRFGGYLTLVIILSLVTYAALSWDYFFTQFHQIFFENGTWRFEYSDTLIRLFPEQFWFDAALAIGGITTAGALILILTTNLLAKRKSRQPDVTGLNPDIA